MYVSLLIHSCVAWKRPRGRKGETKGDKSGGGLTAERREEGRQMERKGGRRERRTLLGWLKRVFLSRPLILSMSACSRFQSMTSRFWRMVSRRVVLGMTARPRWVAQRRRTWAGVLPCFSATDLMVGSSRRGTMAWAWAMLNSWKDRGPKEE